MVVCGESGIVYACVIPCMRKRRDTVRRIVGSMNSLRKGIKGLFVCI
jgi:hypothetical protein